MKVIGVIPQWGICAYIPGIFLEPLLTQLLYIFGINPDMFTLLYHCPCAAQNAEWIMVGQCIEFIIIIVVARLARKIYHRCQFASFRFCCQFDFTAYRWFS